MYGKLRVLLNTVILNAFKLMHDITDVITYVAYTKCVRSLIRKAYGEIIIWMCPQTIVGFRDTRTMGRLARSKIFLPNKIRCFLYLYEEITFLSRVTFYIFLLSHTWFVSNDFVSCVCYRCVFFETACWLLLLRLFVGLILEFYTIIRFFFMG